jgi:hypothetical protein
MMPASFGWHHAESGCGLGGTRRTSSVGCADRREGIAAVTPTSALAMRRNALPYPTARSREWEGH